MTWKSIFSGAPEPHSLENIRQDQLDLVVKEMIDLRNYRSSHGHDIFYVSKMDDRVTHISNVVSPKPYTYHLGMVNIPSIFIC